MHVKTKYIEAIHSAIDFIEENVDGADDENTENELRGTLNELLKAMEESQHKKLVNYYVRKNLKP